MQCHVAASNLFSIGQKFRIQNTFSQSRLQQTTNFATPFPIFNKNKVDITWESSASRRFSLNIMPYLLFLKKRQNLKMSSAANYRGRFMGLIHEVWLLACQKCRIEIWVYQNTINTLEILSKYTNVLSIYFSMKEWTKKHINVLLQKMFWICFC